MQGKTHFRVGIASGVGLAMVYGSQMDIWQTAATIAIAGASAMIPDIDEDGSLINKFLFSKIHRKHRSFALCALGVIVVILAAIFTWPLWVTLTGVFAACVAYVPHRTVTHSLIGVTYVGIVAVLISTTYSFAVLVGYLSHLLIDAFTVAGIPFLWPWKKKFTLKNVGVEIRSGGEFDLFLGRLAVGLSLAGSLFLIYQQVGNYIAF